MNNSIIDKNKADLTFSTIRYGHHYKHEQLAMSLAKELLAYGVEVLPLNPDAEINSQYVYEKNKNCSHYLINSIHKIERYFETFKCHVGFEMNGIRYLLISSENCDQFDEIIVRRYKNIGGKNAIV